MFPHADTYYAAVEAERKLALKRAERRALVAEATRRPRPDPTVARSQAVTVRSDGLARAVRSVRRVLRPVQA